MGSKSRLKEYLDVKRVKTVDFAKKTGFSHTILNSGENLGSDKLETIISVYPDINLHWLVTGNGSMITDSKSYNSNTEGKMFDSNNNSLDNYTIDELITYIHKNEDKRDFKNNTTYKMFLEIRTQREVIKQLKVINERKKQELEKIKQK